MNPGWSLTVPLQPNELLSSWLARAALTQGCDPLVLTGVVWPSWRAWPRDIDRGMSDERVTALAKASGIATQKIEAACLRPTVNIITTESLDNLAIWPGILALGYKNRKRLGGLQYCPACLATGHIPYYRLQWRLAWFVSCPIHSIQLYDRCWRCHAPVQPHRLSAEDTHLGICSNCKNNLGQAYPVPCSKTLIAFQKALNGVMKNGYGYYGTEKITSHEWFRLSRYFLLLLRRVALGQTTGLASVIKTLDVNPVAILAPATGLAFELLPIEERASLLAGVWELLNAGPNRFKDAAMQASLSQATFSGIYQPIPPPITAIIKSLPDRSIPRVKVILTDGICQPRSRQAVMRMFARLQRKLLIMP